ncbi:MAG: hypothetical protein QOF70_4480 [Acetobacteraceae bacterium]|nr:hypothetical protein [Acetobacteraceae bacterium]
MTQQARPLQLVEIALADIASGECVPATYRELAARRVEFLRVVPVIDVVGCDGRLHGPLQQFGIVDDRAVDRRQRPGEAFAIRDKK